MTSATVKVSQLYNSVGQTIARGLNAEALVLLVLGGVDGSACELHMAPSFETRDERLRLARRLTAMLHEAAEQIGRQLEQIATDDIVVMPMGPVPTGEDPS